VAIKQHLDQIREAVAQREKALGAEVDDWERTTAEAAAKRRAELAEVPKKLAVDAATGNIIVADRDNHRVQVLHADGSFVRSFGSRGGGQGQLSSPEGVAGNVIVTDRGNHRVQVWLANGRGGRRSDRPHHRGRQRQQAASGVVNTTFRCGDVIVVHVAHGCCVSIILLM
jgi:hypothetical protein